MNKLWVRLTLSFILVILVGVGTVAVLAGIRADASFREFLVRQELLDNNGVVDQLQAYYETNGSWEGVEELFSSSAGGAGGPQGGMMGRGHGMMRGQVGLVVTDRSGRIVYGDPPGRAGSGQLNAAERRDAEPVVVNGQTVGYVALTGGEGVMMMVPAAQTFMNQLRSTLIVAALLAGALGMLLGIVLSRTLTAPLANLATAARRFAARDWGHRVPVQGPEEVAETAAAFNQMADELQRQETARRNMIADIAHELRTPLTVMQGNLGAMLDELYPLDRKEVATLYDETRLLNRLVDDLRELALADAGKLQLELAPVDLRPLLDQTLAQFSVPAEAQNINLTADAPPALPRVRADSDRVAQVLRNLITNALRHTPAGGSIQLSAHVVGAQIRVSVSDTGEGIAASELPRVFERFYRADKARARGTGGTGLGLAIAKAWIESMGGQIGVESSAGQGSRFWFTLPVA